MGAAGGTTVCLLEICKQWLSGSKSARVRCQAFNAQCEHLVLLGAARRRAEAPNTYDSLLERVRLGELDSKTSAQIETDLPRTFAGMRSFVNSEDGSKSLRSVLSAFALHNTVVRHVGSPWPPCRTCVLHSGLAAMMTCWLPLFRFCADTARA